MEKVRIGVVGCGALAESIYLPLLTKLPGYQIVFLADISMARAQALALKYQVSSWFESHQEGIKNTDAAAVVLALPNYLHANATADCLNAGLHVLVEKPMATRVVDAQRMIYASKANGRVLAVGLVRRFYATTQLIKKVIDEGLFGRLRSVSFEEGCVFNWPIKTDSLISKKLSGGGVLMDIGVHVVDLILYWLGEIESLEYYDDNMGGVEAECYIQFETKNHTSGSIKLSRLRNLQNRAFFDFDKARIEMGLAPNSSLRLRFNESCTFEGSPNPERTPQQLGDIFRRQLDNFYYAIVSNDEILIPGEEGIKSLAFIERCYQSVKPLSNCYQHF
jgi:predicted dehydrogenase